MRGMEEIRRYRATPGRQQPGHVIVVCLTEQQAIPYSDELELFLRNELRLIAADRRFAMFQIGEMDFVFLSSDERTRLYGSVSEIRAVVLRGVDRFVPGSFGAFDQSRLIQTYDLTVLNETALAVVEAFAERMARRTAGAKPVPRLTHDHLVMIEEASRRMGTAELARRIVRRQNAYMVQSRSTFVPAFTEFYCCTEAIRREVIGDVDFRQDKQLFNLLTLSFDRLILRSFEKLNPERDRCSLNLNVETVFTTEFETFLKASVKGDLSRFVIELRASDILQNFDEFLVARDFLTERGAVLAVDALFPKMLGLLDLRAMGIRIAKLFASDDSFATLPQRRAALSDLQAGGVALILARTQDKRMHELGLDVGIRMFQGFHIDRLAGSGPGVLKG